MPWDVLSLVPGRPPWTFQGFPTWSQTLLDSADLPDLPDRLSPAIVRRVVVAQLGLAVDASASHTSLGQKRLSDLHYAPEIMPSHD